MREIKFRGKMIPENEWIYGTLLRIPHPPVCMGKEENDKYYIQFADPRYMSDWNMPYKMVQGEVESETIGQYTGLYDKNNVEIYEGDIVNITRTCVYEKGTIINKNGCYFVKVKDTLLALYEAEINNYKLEVIGNIYDNKNLLEN